MVEKYFLQVDLMVPKASIDAFDTKMRKFLTRHAFRFMDERFTYELALALKSDPTKNAFTVPWVVSSKQSQPQATEKGAAHYIHLWRVPNETALNLAMVMKFSVEDALYREIDGLVAYESQNLILHVLYPQVPPSHMTLASAQTDKVTRVTRRFSSVEMGTFLGDIPEKMPALAQQNPHTLGPFFNVTGPLNVTTEFWIDAKEPTESPANNHVELREDFVRAPYFVSAGGKKNG